MTSRPDRAGAPSDVAPLTGVADAEPVRGTTPASPADVARRAEARHD